MLIGREKKNDLAFKKLEKNEPHQLLVKRGYAVIPH